MLEAIAYAPRPHVEKTEKPQNKDSREQTTQISPSLNRRMLIESVLLVGDTEDEWGQGLTGEYVTFERGHSKAIERQRILKVIRQRGKLMAWVRWEEGGIMMQKFFPVDDALRQNIADNKINVAAEQGVVAAESTQSKPGNEKPAARAFDVERIMETLEMNKNNLLLGLNDLTATPEENEMIIGVVKNYFHAAEIFLSYLDNNPATAKEFLPLYNASGEFLLKTLEKLRDDWEGIDTGKRKKAQDKINVLANYAAQINALYTKAF